jgi:sigma-E factor negative regulatory protein RseB
LAKGARPKNGHTEMGATHFYANVVDGRQITVVGEVPEATVAKIAHAISFNK